MNAGQVLQITLREMQAIGRGWRADWNGFDGRTLRDQLDSLADWARGALADNYEGDYMKGTEFYKEQTLPY